MPHTWKFSRELIFKLSFPHISVFNNSNLNALCYVELDHNMYEHGRIHKVLTEPGDEDLRTAPVKVLNLFEAEKKAVQA